MNFFFDNNLSPRLARAMNCLEQESEVAHLTENFPRDAIDEDWMKYIGENKIILITQDKKILRRVAELKAFKKYKIGAFILTGQNRDIWKTIEQIVKKWQEIKTLVARTRLPFAFRVPFRGKIERLNL